jgi:alpha-L-rhamnosidase
VDLSKLRASQRVHWTVQVFDGGGHACEPAAASWFETALEPGEKGWQGSEWLARFAPAPLNASGCDLYDPSNPRTHAPRFRAKLSVPATVVSARAYIVGLGYYQLYIDGQRVCDSQLDPGWTTYNKRVLYAVYDVSAQLLVGRNGEAAAAVHVVGVELGNGWFNPMTLKMWGHTDLRGALTVSQGRGNATTTEPMFRLKVVGMMSDGSQRTLLVSSSTPTHSAGGGGWAAASSPTTFNNIYLGEKYDARMEPDAGANSWSTLAALEDSSSSGTWDPAVPAGTAQAESLGELEPQMVP